MLILNGEGEYNLNSVKEIKTTQAYLNLNKNLIGCQSEEIFENCTTHENLNHYLQNCECLPLGIRKTDKVKTK